MRNLGYCQLCEKKVGYYMARHYAEVHPEYGFRSVHRAYKGRQKLVYECTTCSSINSGFGKLVHHYQTFHPKDIRPIVSTSIIQPPAEVSYDSVAEIIGHLNAKVKELKGDNDVLSKSMVELANVLHRTQVEALELQQENDNLARINDDLNNKLVARQGLFQRVMVEARQILGKGD